MSSPSLFRRMIALSAASLAAATLLSAAHLTAAPSTRSARPMGRPGSGPDALAARHNRGERGREAMRNHPKVLAHVAALTDSLNLTPEQIDDLAIFIKGREELKESGRQKMRAAREFWRAYRGRDPQGGGEELTAEERDAMKAQMEQGRADREAFFTAEEQLLEGAKATLTPEQLAAIDAYVKAHEAELQALREELHAQGKAMRGRSGRPTHPGRRGPGGGAMVQPGDAESGIMPEPPADFHDDGPEPGLEPGPEPGFEPGPGPHAGRILRMARMAPDDRYTEGRNRLLGHFIQRHDLDPAQAEAFTTSVTTFLDEVRAMDGPTFEAQREELPERFTALVEPYINHRNRAIEHLLLHPHNLERWGK